VYTEKEIEDLISPVKIQSGTFYMYSLPASILKRKVIKRSERILIDPNYSPEGHGIVSIFLTHRRSRKRIPKNS